MRKESILRSIQNYLSIIEKMSLKSDKILQGLYAGIHKSPYVGFSADFEDHRQYYPGDNIKMIDWPLWGRTEKLFVKRYKEDTNSQVHILMDASLSMNYPVEELTKLDRSKQISILLFLLFRSQNDRVSLSYFNNDLNFIIPPNQLFPKKDFIEGVLNIKADKKSKFYGSMERFIEFVKTKSIVIIISDLIFENDDLKKGLNLLRFYKHDIITIHVLSKHEVSFNPKKDGNYYDPENRENSIHVSKEGISGYRENLSSWIKDIDDMYNKLELTRCPIDTEQDILKFLMLLTKYGNGSWNS